MSTNAQQTQLDIRKDIISSFGIDKLSEDKREEAIMQIGKIIFQGTLMRVLPLLEEEQVDRYNELMDTKPDPIKVMEFFLEEVPTFMEILADESESLRKKSQSLIDKL